MRNSKFTTVMFFAIITIVLGGCGSFSIFGSKGNAVDKDVVVKYETVAVLPPDNLIMDCLVEAPPDKDQYKNASMKDREKLLYELSMRQMKNTFVCNARLQELRKWKAQQETIYKASNVK